MLLAIALLDYDLLRRSVPYVPGIAGALLVAALLTQVGLASVWAAIGRDAMLPRACVLIAALLGVWLVLFYWNERAQEEMLRAYWVQAVIAAGGLFVLRVLGLQTLRRGEPALESAAAPPRFSIRDLLLVTTLVCLALAGVMRMEGLTTTQDAALISLAVGGFIGAITLAAVFTTLVFRHFLLPMLVVCAGSVLLGWGIGTIVRYETTLTMVALGVPTGGQVVRWHSHGWPAIGLCVRARDSTTRRVRRRPQNRQKCARLVPSGVTVSGTKSLAHAGIAVLLGRCDRGRSFLVCGDPKCRLLRKSGQGRLVRSTF